VLFRSWCGDDDRIHQAGADEVLALGEDLQRLIFVELGRDRIRNRHQLGAIDFSGRKIGRMVLPDIAQPDESQAHFGHGPNLVGGGYEGQRKDSPSWPCFAKERGPGTSGQPQLATFHTGPIISVLMEMHQLRYFLAVADEGNFSRAARKAHVAQPSLSQQIQKLELEVGQPLFDRLPRTVLLTEAGKRFLEFAQRILANVADAQKCIDEYKGQPVGKLVIGAIPTIAPYLLPRLLPRFHQEHPQVRVEVIEDVTENLTRSLEEGEVDLGLLSTCEYEDFSKEPLGEEPLLVAVPAGHRLTKKGRVTWRDLRQERFLALHQAHCLSRQVEEFCSAHGLHPELAVRGAQLLTIVGMVAAGMGLSLVPQMMVDAEGNKGCSFLPFAAPVPTRQLNIVRNPLRFQSKAALAFTGTAVTCFSEPRDEPLRRVERSVP